MEQRFHSNYRIPSARLPGWDYASAGYYFTTICTQHFIPYFGEIHGGMVQLSVVGEIARRMWEEIPAHFPSAALDEFVVMPNHVHGIIIINSAETQHAASLPGQQGAAPLQLPKPGSVSAVVRSYKSAVTRWAHENGHGKFGWQTRFYDHIIRDQKSYENIQTYIRANPDGWEQDDYYPKPR